MTKMKLELSALEVQSFEPAANVGTRPGTVNGHAVAQTSAGCPGTNHDHCPSVGCTFFRPCDTIEPCESGDCIPSEYYVC